MYINLSPQDINILGPVFNDCFNFFKSMRNMTILQFETIFVLMIAYSCKYITILGCKLLTIFSNHKDDLLQNCKVLMNYISQKHYHTHLKKIYKVTSVNLDPNGLESFFEIIYHQISIFKQSTFFVYKLDQFQNTNDSFRSDLRIIQFINVSNSFIAYQLRLMELYLICLGYNTTLLLPELNNTHRKEILALYGKLLKRCNRLSDDDITTLFSKIKNESEFNAVHKEIYTPKKRKRASVYQEAVDYQRNMSQRRRYY